MPIPGEHAALPPEGSPVKRRLAAQYVREARDRLTSTSGTRPAHGGTFTLKSKLRIGTEVVVTLPPGRVVAAIAPLSEPRRRLFQIVNRNPDRRKSAASSAGGCSVLALKSSSVATIAQLRS